MDAVDTNVLVYAYDESSPAKRDRARELLKAIPDGVLLWQVACEFVAASRKLLGPAADLAPAWERLDEIRAVMRLVAPQAGVLDRAREIQGTTRAQFWDCMIYAACKEAGVSRFYTEDAPSATIPHLEIVNPFR